MSFNIMDSFNQQTNASTIGAVARMLGEDQKKTQQGITAALPTLLSALQKSPNEAFNDAYANADPALAGNIRSVLGSSSRWSMMKTGNKMLQVALDEPTLSTLSQALATYSGLPQASSRSLLGIIAPFVMSKLTQQAQSSGLDSAGVLQMLQSQHDNINQAIPEDLHKALQPAATEPAPPLAEPPAAAPTDVPATKQPHSEPVDAKLKPEPPVISQPAPEPTATEASATPAPPPQAPEPAPTVQSETPVTAQVSPAPALEAEQTPAPQPSPEEQQLPKTKATFLLSMLLLILLAIAAWFSSQ